MSLQVWLPLNQGPENVITDISNFGKESGISITADTNGWYKIADSSHTSSRWGIYKDFYVKSNTTYTLNVYAKSTTGVTANVGIQSFNGYTSWPTQRETYNGSSEKLITFTWTTAATDNYARVYLAMNPSSTVANNYVFYKGVEILEVPEIKNQGLADVGVINNGATYSSTGGKIGGCYNFNGSSNYLYTTEQGYFGNNYSFSAWIYTTSTSATQTIGCIRTAVGSGFSLFLISGKLRIDPGGNNIQWTTSYTYPANTWFHLVVTYDGTAVKYYINGEYKQSYTTTISSTYWGNTLSFGASQANGSNYANYLNGRLNDIRVYNHALSQMEVKEIAKGLILHYPLNRKGFGQDNILINTHFDSRYSQTTGWDTTKNGTLMASSWGGYNSGVTNQATVYHAHLKEFNGEWVYEYVKTANESWLCISQGGLQSKLTAGKTYTFSWEEYHVDGVNRVGTGLYYYKTGATSANFHLGIKQASEVTRDIGRWQKYTYTFTAPNDADWSKNMSWYVYGHYNGNGTFYLRHIKLEEGSIPTPWSPNQTDIFINLFDFNSTLEYDTSGFNNHGTRIGTFTYSSDTSKYHVSTQFDTTSTKIKLPVMNFTGMANSYTFAWWQYNISTGNMPWGFSDGNRLNCYHCSPLCWNTGDGSNNKFKDGSTTIAPTTVQNGWHHMVVTGDGTATKLYIDGIYKGAATTYKPLTGTQIWISGWDSGTSYTFSGSKECDFRIYATALSASDVLELYNNKNF